MSFNRWVNVVLAILVVIWGGLSVDAARTVNGLTATPLPNDENKTVQNSPENGEKSATPVALKTVQNQTSPKPTSSAESIVRNLFAGRVAPPTPTVSPTPMSTVAPTPTVALTPTATPTSTPIASVSYRIQGGGVFYEGTYDASGLSVGEFTKRVAALQGFAFTYDATPLGWYVTGIAGVKQNPAQDNYWLYWVNGVFGDVSADKKILQPGDTLVWQYGS